MRGLVYLIAFGIIIGSFLGYMSTVREARAYGSLLVNTSVPAGDPIFVINNWLPGDCETRNITITQDGNIQTDIATKGLKIASTNNLIEVTDFIITLGSTSYFSGTLKDFFAASSGTNSIALGSLNPGASRTYKFTACFQENAGNAYQKASVIFDLIFGETFDNSIELPTECSHLKGIITKTIEGTDKKDKLRGSHESELILGYGGNDVLDGGSGHDCIVGGEGNDKLDGGAGKDIIISGPGNDKVDGGASDDIIYGNDGNDKLEGGSGNDLIYAGPGNDNLSGGSGADSLWGGPGNDRINGDSGKDACFEGEHYTSCEN